MKTFESFEALALPATMKQALRDMAFVTPTPIQAQAIPAALDNYDVVGTAQTGTGKTAAFGIPMLNSLYTRPGSMGLVLAPTRELAAQIHKVLREIARGSSLVGTLVVGGESMRRQIDELHRGVDYIVATPGRLNDLLKQRAANLSNVEVLVLDEVDRMLDMGFLPQIKDVLRFVPENRQTLLFSATLPSDVARFVEGLVYQPVRVAVGDSTKPTTLVTETIRRVSGNGKNVMLLDELEKRAGKILVFVRTKSRTQRLLRLLEKEGYSAVCLHGGRSQGQRKVALEKFRRNSSQILVATDLAGRGLDIDDIDHVVNFDVPSTREDYIHRIGRTGRAGARGEAVSFVEEGNADEEHVVTGKKVERAPGAVRSGHRPPQRQQQQRRPRRASGGYSRR